MTETITPYFDAFSELFDRFTEIWDGISADFDDWVLAALPARSRTAVDLGCGAGRHSVLLAGRADRVLAVDVSDRMLAVARDQRAVPAVDYQRRGVLDVSPAEGPFDVVLSVHTLHHVGAPALVLPHVRSLVAPGGTAVVADIVDPGGWRTPDFHVDRAFGDARVVHQLTGDSDAAADVLRLLLHPRWLELTVADTPLSRATFHRTYADVFPGAAFHDDLHPLMCGMVWQAPL
jgi:2-polyprenyl-3-methyl-5-hydroxy-6-metoxy-1,4-benzoquinol methylase